MSPGDLGWLLLGTVGPSFLLAWMLGHVVRRLAPRWGLVDRPGARKVHEHPTPLGGGIAIWAGVVLTFLFGAVVVLVALGSPTIAERLPELVRPHLTGMRHRLSGLAVLLGGGTALMLLGLVDDKRGLDWRIRLGAELLVATVCVVWQGWTLTAFLPWPLLTAGLSVLWIGALINSFNMLDNMDGLSAGVAAISASVLAAFLLLPVGGQSEQPQLFVAALLLVLVGALLGFLIHNRPPARMFMGDAGSYFVGFCMAVATLLATYTTYRGGRWHAVLAPVCVLAVPMYDMSTVLWIRIREGRSPFAADKCHFSHRLVDLGLTKTQAVLTIYLLTLTCGLGALLLHRVDGVGAVLVVALILCVLALIHILEATARRKLKP